MIKSSLKALSLAISFVFLSACAITHSSYMPEMKITTIQKDESCVEFLAQKPQRAAIRIGLISVNGNGFSNAENLIQEAKKKAAEIGGDFVLVENAGVETKTVYSPGYSTYQASGYEHAAAYGNPYAFSARGYGSQQSSGYSIGPGINTYDFPWGIFSVWVYAPSQIGIRFNEMVVTGFHLNSDAETAGVQIGDTLLGIDGHDVQDEGLVEHLMSVPPGQKVNVSLQRNGKRYDFIITTIKN